MEETSGKIIKSGVKTTEFLVTILTIVGSVTGTLAGILDPKIGAILMSISGGAYAISRGLAKN